MCTSFFYDFENGCLLLLAHILNKTLSFFICFKTNIKDLKHIYIFELQLHYLKN